MQLQVAVTTALLFAEQIFPVFAHAFPRQDKNIPNVHPHRHVELESGVRRSVDRILHLHQRQESPGPSASSSASVQTQSTDTAAVDPDKWNSQTQAACNEALSILNGNAPNPSGMAVCYNLPYLNNVTGIFQADLRLYRIADPRDDWARIKNQDVSVGLSYAGASVAAGNTNLGSRDYHISPTKRDLVGELGRRQDNAPQMLQIFNFVGQINSDLMDANMNASQFKELLMPDISLNAVSPIRGPLNTTLSVKDTSFVNGVFAGNKPSTSAASASATPFVLPGTTPGIFPTGLIITTSWAVVFVSVVLWGTMGRYQFREHYRRRLKRGQAMELRTI